MLLRTLALTLLLAPLGCGDDITPADTDAAVADGGGATADAPVSPPDADTRPDATPPKPTLAWCVDHDVFAPAPAGDWSSGSSSTIAALGSPAHSAQDVIVPVGTAVTLPGKFAYTAASIDLGDEAVLVYLDACAGWELLGTGTTDGNGILAFPVTRSLPLGVYDVRFEVVGDASLTRSRIWVLPVGTHLAVIDIDGTMTTSDSELFTSLYDGSYVPVAYPSAVELTVAERGIGRVPL
jgi:hypothetical protein